MQVVEFIFAFLYVRNWHTGQHELSRVRVSIFAAGVFLLVLGIALVAIMQMPVTYESA